MEHFWEGSEVKPIKHILWDRMYYFCCLNSVFTKAYEEEYDVQTTEIHLLSIWEQIICNIFELKVKNKKIKCPPDDL